MPGTINAVTIVVQSAIYPINKGPITPPTGDIIRKDDARFVWFPKFLNDKANIVGNIIDSKTYPQSNATRDTIPMSNKTTNVVITVPDAQINNKTSARMHRIIQLPIKRPAMNKLNPPKDNTSDALRAFIQFCSTT